MQQERLKRGISFYTEIEILEDMYWIKTVIEDSRQALPLDELPERDWINYYHTKRYFEEEFSGTYDYKAQPGRGSVLTIRIPVDNLVYAKFYKDSIYLGLLKWQATFKEEENYGPKDFTY